MHVIRLRTQWARSADHRGGIVQLHSSDASKTSLKTASALGAPSMISTLLVRPSCEVEQQQQSSAL